MKKFFAAALLSAAIFAAGPVYAEALPKAPPSSISLPGGGGASPSSGPCPPVSMKRAAPCGPKRRPSLRCGLMWSPW